MCVSTDVSPVGIRGGELRDVLQLVGDHIVDECLHASVGANAVWLEQRHELVHFVLTEEKHNTSQTKRESVQTNSAHGMERTFGYLRRACVLLLFVVGLLTAWH
jgi:hypothetical protein